MASWQNFEASINEGINGDGSSWGAPYITDIDSSVVKPLNELSEDNFYPGDGKSISQTSTEFEEIDADVEKTEILYEMNPEKKTLMEKILSEMEELKALKAGVDGSKLGNECNTYNNCLHGAKWGFVNDEFVKFCEAVNKQTYKKTIQEVLLKPDSKGNWHPREKECIVGEWRGTTYTYKRPVADTGYRYVADKRSEKYNVGIPTRCEGKACGPNSAADYQKSVVSMYNSLSKYGATKDIPSVPAPRA